MPCNKPRTMAKRYERNQDKVRKKSGYRIKLHKTMENVSNNSISRAYGTNKIQKGYGRNQNKKQRYEKNQDSVNNRFIWRSSAISVYIQLWFRIDFG